MEAPFFGQDKECDTHVDTLRVGLKALGGQIMDLKEVIAKKSSDAPEGVNVGEMLANITLAYRAVEDASMRLGKVKQHNNGGESVYDKNVVGSPAETATEEAVETNGETAEGKE